MALFCSGCAIYALGGLEPVAFPTQFSCVPVVVVAPFLAKILFLSLSLARFFFVAVGFVHAGLRHSLVSCNRSVYLCVVVAASVSAAVRSDV